jgi:hypothetical protein
MKHKVEKDLKELRRERNYIVQSPTNTNSENKRKRIHKLNGNIQTLEKTLSDRYQIYTESKKKLMNDLPSQSVPIMPSVPYVHTKAPPAATVRLFSNPSDGFKIQTHTSPKAPLPSPKAPLPSPKAPLPLPPPPPPPTRNRVLRNIKMKTTEAVNKIVKGNNNSNEISNLAEMINLKENFKKRNALTAELKRKTIRGLNQQLKNEGKNLSGSREPVVEPVVETVVKPVAGPKYTSADELNENLMRSIQKGSIKKAPLTPHQLLKGELGTLYRLFQSIVPQAKQYIVQVYAARSPSARNIDDKLTTYIATLESYRSDLNRFREYDNLIPLSDEVKAFIKKCMKPISDIKEIIYKPIFGGKRRTQKNRKQKKRFGTQKK